MNSNNKYEYIETYLETIRAKGRYSFSLEELLNEFAISYNALKQRLYHLKQKNKIAQMPSENCVTFAERRDTKTIKIGG